MSDNPLAVDTNIDTAENTDPGGTLVAPRAPPRKESLFIYVVIIVVFVILLLAIVSYIMVELNQQQGCEKLAGIRCWNDWRCATNCTDYGACFANGTSPGLPECIYGPTTPLASACNNEATLDGTCSCPFDATNTQNCLSGCPVGLNGTNTPSTCCTAGSTDPGCPTGNS